MKNNIFLTGKYISGQGKAHKCCSPHEKVFNCRMYGTFNICLEEGSILQYPPSIKTKKASYWFLKITKENSSYFGWAIRDHTSHQLSNIVEILTKELLPECLKEGFLSITLLKKWEDKKIQEWAKKQYWFQTFPFSPIKKADSKYLWDVINKISWSNYSVLDIGSHYGYFSFEASKKGAQVIGIEPNANSIAAAEVIRDNIIQQDVVFLKQIPKKDNFDIILYLSVHHQIDPKYVQLKKKIEELKNKTNQHLFVELIIPPLFPKGKTLSEKQIDLIVGGIPLARYNHRVRGIRKVYWIKKNV